MATRHEKLMYTVSLLDRVSGPSKKISQHLDRMTQRFNTGITRIAKGAAGLFSVGFALKGILAPAVEMDRALNGLRSLGVGDTGLKKLEQQALDFTSTYGGVAADVVNSSYDIQSAIGGLSDNELARFMSQGALLAKATKANSNIITDYMGTMYGVFKTQADAMGKSQWVDELTNMTAAGVERFKTTGDKMASAFSRLGSNATARGVGMAEQMAVMGTLQATMGGGESATKYQAFLSKVGVAQEALGMQFSDSHGRMLPVVDILTKLKARFGDMDKTADMDLLAKAFGGKEGASFIAALAKDIPGLANSIEVLNVASSTDKATQMAQAQIDPWEQLGAVVRNTRTAFARLLQPVLNPLVNKFTQHLEQLRKAMDRYPNITKLVGKLTLGVFALVAGLSTLALIMGIGKFAMIGLTGVLVTARVAMWLFNLAMLGNPITWIVLAVGLLIIGIVNLVYKFGSLKKAWQASVEWLSNNKWAGNFFELINKGIENLKRGWSSFWNLLKLLNPAKLIGKAFDWIVQKWNALPFVNKVEIGDMTLGGIGEASSNSAVVNSRVPTGGLMQDIINSDNRRSNYVEKLEVNTTQKVDGWWLDNQLATVGG